MAETTSISWCDATWNPLRGCSRISAGCGLPIKADKPDEGGCYAEALALRYGWSKLPWTPENAEANVQLRPERLYFPATLKKPSRIFTVSIGDPFHEVLVKKHPQYIAKMYAVMYLTPQHTHQVLTKRPHEAAKWYKDYGENAVMKEAQRILDDLRAPKILRHIREPWHWPLRNVHLGVTVESNATKSRLGEIQKCPAALYWCSYEPALEYVDFNLYVAWNAPAGSGWSSRGGISWIVAGGESGPQRRPCEVAWFQRVADLCKQAGVPFFCKQDSHRLPGQQGRIPDELWARKEFPNVV